MKIIDSIRPIFKWWYLVAISTVIAAVSSFIATRDVPPVYMAQTTIMIGNAILDPNPSDTELGVSQRLAQAYADIAMREPVVNATEVALGVKELPKFDAYPLSGGPFVEITVTHTDPKFAQAVAQELAHQLMLQSPTTLTKEEQERQSFVNQQMLEISAQIQDTQKEITAKQDSLGNLVSATDIAQTQADITALDSKLTTLQGIFSNLLAGSQKSALNTLSIFEPATLPTKPIGPNKLLIILLATVSGFALAVGAAYLIEFLDDTIHTGEDVTHLLNLPVIAYIGKTPDDQGKPFVIEEPRSPIAEAFRTLRTNLEYSSFDQPCRVILITSADPSEGKTTVAVNLALTMAQAGKKVVLLDADLRRPQVHEFLNLPAKPGLSEVFRNHSTIVDVIQTSKENKNLAVIGAGTIPPNSSELLSSNKMDKNFSDLLEISDVVIVDGPPFFVSDASILASKVEGVVVVIHAGQTRKGAIQAMKTQIDLVNANVLGVVLNQVSGGSSYYSGYYNNNYYVSDTKQDDSKQLKRQPRLRLNLFSEKANKTSGSGRDIH